MMDEMTDETAEHTALLNSRQHNALFHKVLETKIFLWYNRTTPEWEDLKTV